MGAVACVLVPRFALRAAMGGARELLLEPVALAPEPGGYQVVGEVSAAAEAFGVEAGMRLGEALARCPQLRLVPADPDAAERAWETVLARLEGIGAEVEPARPGECYFDAGALSRMAGGVEAVLLRARRAARGARLAAAPSRFCSYAVAREARPRGAPTIVRERAARAFLASRPVSLLRARSELVDLPTTLERLGIETLGQLASLPASDLTDRFGRAGLLARTLAEGEDSLLRPRVPVEPLREALELPEAVSGGQLHHALGLLVDRLLARHDRRGRTVRRLRLGGELAEGGSWRTVVALREATASPERIRLALEPRLAALPSPAVRLGLEAVELGPPAADQASLERSAGERRQARLAEAVRQARAAAGRDAVLHVLEVDPRSRLPERRAILTPFE